MSSDNGPLEALARDISNNFICSCEWPSSDGDKCQCGGDGTDGMEGCWKCQADAALCAAPAPGTPGPLEVATRALERIERDCHHHPECRAGFSFIGPSCSEYCGQGVARRALAALRGMVAPAGQPAALPCTCRDEPDPRCPRHPARDYAAERAAVAAPVPAEAPTPLNHDDLAAFLAQPHLAECSGCGCRTWHPLDLGTRRGMRQSDGRTCRGFFPGRAAPAVALAETPPPERCAAPGCGRAENDLCHDLEDHGAFGPGGHDFVARAVTPTGEATEP